MPQYGQAEAVLQMWGHVAAPVLCCAVGTLADLSIKPFRWVPCCLQYELVLPGPVQLVTLGRNVVGLGWVADETLLGQKLAMGRTWCPQGFWQGCRQQPGKKTSPRAEQQL